MFRSPSNQLPFCSHVFLAFPRASEVAMTVAGTPTYMAPEIQVTWVQFGREFFFKKRWDDWEKKTVAIVLPISGESNNANLW